MAMLERKKSYVSIKTKLEKIITFCASLGINAKNLIIRNIQEKTDDLSDKCALLIDVLWKSIKGLESGDDKIIIIEAMNILSHVLDMLGIVNPILTLVSYVVQLVAFFLKVIFHLINLKKIPEPKITPNDTLRHELAGLAERIQRTVIFIDAVDDEEHVEEATLQGLISNVDIHIGVDQLGNLKSRIKTFMSGGKEDWRTCLELLKMFVRISTLRHALLFRMLTCLRAKDYSRGTVIALQKYIEIERKDNQTFLGFFSLPTLENVGILAFFNPSDEDELLTYLEKLRLSFQNLRVVLHEQMFFITQKTNPNILWGRPLASVCSVRAIKSCSTDVQNRRIRFKFVAIENEFNLFHIQSPDSDDYVFMKENSYCKYSKSVKDPDTAKWRVILVHDTDEKEEAHSCFTLCTKKWPEKFVFMEDTFFKSARGLGINSKPSMECLFTVSLLRLFYFTIFPYPVSFINNLRKESKWHKSLYSLICILVGLQHVRKFLTFISVTSLIVSRLFMHPYMRLATVFLLCLVFVFKTMNNMLTYENGQVGGSLITRNHERDEVF